MSSGAPNVKAWAGKIRLRVPIMSFDPNSTYLVVEMENKPGVLARVLRVLSERNINVLEGVHSRGYREDRGFWLAVVEKVEEKMFKEAIEEIRAQEGVLGVLADSKRYGGITLPPIGICWEVVGDMPVTLWRKIFTSIMFKGLRSELKEMADVMLFHLGFQAGYQIYDYWRDTIGVSGRKLVEACLIVLENLNWIDEWEVQKFNIEKRDFRISVSGNFETYQVNADRPVCYFTSGLYSGFHTKLTGVKIRMREIKCQAKGDENCVFQSEEIT